MTFYETIKSLEGKTIKEIDCTKTGDFKSVSIEATDGTILKIYAAVSQPFNSPALQARLNEGEIVPR